MIPASWVSVLEEDKIGMLVNRKGKRGTVVESSEWPGDIRGSMVGAILESPFAVVAGIRF